MKLLALATATEACSVALWLDGEVRVRFELGNQHSERILPVVEGGRVVGVITRTDLLNILVGQRQAQHGAAAEALRESFNPRTRNVIKFMQERLSPRILGILKGIGETASRGLRGLRRGRVRARPVPAPVFSPDGRTVIFSGVVNQPAASTTWLDDFFGVRVARAHNAPSDLWAVAVSAGQPALLAHLGSVGLYPDFSPDGEHIAFLSLSGIYVMKADGTQIAQISTLGGSGTLQWLP